MTKLSGCYIVRYADGTFYVGEFDEGKRSGLGLRTLKNSNVYYYGHYKNGLKDGFGKLIDLEDDTVIYEGEFKKGKKHGHGNYQKVGQLKYKGEFF
jgi:hypothetical protein